MKFHSVAVSLATATALSLAAPVAAATVPIDYNLIATANGVDVNLGTMVLDYDGSTYSLESLFLSIGKTGFVTSDLTLAPVPGTSDYCLYTFSSCTIVPQKDSLYIIFDPSLTSQTSTLFVYNPTDLTTSSGSIIIERAVPEPATWVMMLFGLGGIGALTRLRSRRIKLAVT